MIAINESNLRSVKDFKIFFKKLFKDLNTDLISSYKTALKSVLERIKILESITISNSGFRPSFRFQVSREKDFLCLKSSALHSLIREGVKSV